MKVSHFITMLREGVDFESAKLLSYRKPKKGFSVDDKLKTRAKKLLNMSSYVLTKYREELDVYNKKDLATWTFKKLDVSGVESVVDFNKVSDERIKISAENYSAYIDQILNDEDDGSNADLEFELFGNDKKKKFKAKMLGSAALTAKQGEIGQFLPLASLDIEYMYLAQYLMATDDIDHDIEVSEAIARGMAYVVAVSAIGQFVNKNLTKLFDDFF